MKKQSTNLKIVLFAFLVFMVAGCASTWKPVDQGRTVNSRAFVELKRGISLAEMESVFQIKPTHEFTVRRDDETIRCVRYDLIAPATSQAYYFVFTNDALSLICLPPLVEYGTRTENDIRFSFAIVQPEKDVETVLHSAGLNGEALAKSVSQVMALKPSKDSGSEPWNILPAFIILSPLFIATAPLNIAKGHQWRHEFEEQRAQYDPFKVGLGMAVGEVEAMFGAPFTIGATLDGLEIRYYGSPKFVGYSGELWLPAKFVGYSDELWLSVVFDQGKAVRVFSDRFFDKEMIRVLLREKSTKH